MNFQCYLSGWVYRLLLVMAMLLMSIKGHAYSLQNHEEITRDASELINLCVEKKLIKTLNPSSQLDVLVQYNLQQDQLWRKARLWHFPKSDSQPLEKSITSWIGNSFVISTSFNVWSDYLGKQASSSVLQHEVYPAIGALLHYLQDVAVPTHAVPIFHPVRYIPPKADGFDSWDVFNAPPWLEDNNTLNTVCAQLASTEESAIEIINSTLEKTRNNILKGSIVDGDNNQLWLKLYPVNGPKQHGFGQYGCNSEGQFGGGSVTCQNQVFHVTKQQYINFASRQRNLAVQASAQLIYLLQHNLLPCMGDDCFAPMGDDRWLPNAEILNELMTR